jgi:hypothetical protein
LLARRQTGEAYDDIARGELEYAMPASSSPPPSLHHIGIIVSPVGRVLQCRECQLSFTIPDGITFGVIAKQFDVHSCVSPVRIPGWHTDRRFVVLRYEGKVPALASCAKCERKFFTLPTLARDPRGAEEYLGRKFDVHQCEEPKG